MSGVSEMRSVSGDMEGRHDEERSVEVHAVYRHFKGNYYYVESLATDSETLEDMVVYRKLYGDGGLWVRPARMFLSSVDRAKYPDVTQEWRFERVEL